MLPIFMVMALGKHEHPSLPVCAIVLGVRLAKWVLEFWLRSLNERHVLANARTVPEAFKGAIDEATYAKSVQYTLAKSRFGQIEDTFGLVILIAALLSGV